MRPRQGPPSCTFTCVIRRPRVPAWKSRFIGKWWIASEEAGATSFLISRPGLARASCPAKKDPEKPGAGTTLRLPAERVQHVLELKPEICSLDMGSLNMGPHVFINTPSHLEAMAIAIRAAGVLPELEVFETGHLRLAKRMIEDGHINPPGMFQLCLGIAWGQPATPEAMSYMRTLLPEQSPWFAFGISLHQFPMAAQAVLLGGHPRVGMEDNIYLEKGKLAPSNAALVEKAAKIVEILGDNVATPAEARQMLGIQHRTPFDLIRSHDGRSRPILRSG